MRRTLAGPRVRGKSGGSLRHNGLREPNRLGGRGSGGIVRRQQPMATAPSVTLLAAGASFTKAALGMDGQHSLHRVRLRPVMWFQKLIAADCQD